VSASAGRYDRRTFLGRGATAAGLTAAAVTAPALLSACGASSPSTTGSRVTTPGVSTLTPRRGGSVLVGVSSEIDGFLPPTDHWDNTGYCYASAVYDSLTAQAADGSIRPNLASSVTPNADLTEWTLTVRPGITFHDGSPLNADVVYQNMKAIKESALTGQAVAFLTNITMTGDMTVVFTCEEPIVAFPAYLTSQVGYIIALSQLDANDSQHPVGTGPFKYGSWEPNDHFTVTRNPAYWRKGLPYLDTVTYHPIISDESRESALRSGTVDIMVSHDPGIIADLQHDASYQQVTDLHSTVGQPDMDFICLNCDKPPTNDLTVRQALAYASNAEELVRLFGRGVTTVNQSLFPPGSPYRAANNGYPTYNLAKARQLVAQAKANHGGSININLADITDPRQTEIIQALQSMWTAAGITVTLSQIQQVTYIDNLVTGSFQAAADEMFSAADPDLNYVWLSSTTASGPIALNFARLKNPQIEAALQQGRTHSEKAARIEAYQTVDRLLSENLPYIWFNGATWSVTANHTTMNFANPVLPDGTSGRGFQGGVFSPTPMWTKA
jgi:peptide/nickel transport system substrate-binding protein